jgi:23S rRNA pseudouridine1911/1915/1917 synthase
MDYISNSHDAASQSVRNINDDIDDVDDVDDDEEAELADAAGENGMYEHFRFVADKGQQLLRVDKF